MATPPDLTIAVVLYDEMTTLDVVGPMEMLRFLPGSRLSFVAERVGPIETDTGVLTLGATVTFDDDLAPDVVVVPGGPGTKAAMASPLIGWLRRVHPTTRWTTSVCSGSLLLGAAGLLEGARATSHFAVAEHLDRFGAVASSERVVIDHDRHIITAAGVSSGIDMALMLAELLSDATTAQAIQLVTEYDPKPPHASGSLASASAATVARAIEIGTPHGAIPFGWTPKLH